jgi:hypothetical protein
VTATKILAGKISGITPGQMVTKHWNNANPSDAVWYVQAIPTFDGVPKELGGVWEVEVTRVWRRKIRVHHHQAPSSVEDEIHYEIKNVGTETVTVNVYLGVID